MAFWLFDFDQIYFYPILIFGIFILTFLIVLFCLCCLVCCKCGRKRKVPEIPAEPNSAPIQINIVQPQNSGNELLQNQQQNSNRQVDELLDDSFSVGGCPSSNSKKKSYKILLI